jgi:mannose-6-phosphate isomerase-like protein (cupin superfamily)
VFFVADCQDGAVEMGIADPKLEEWEDAKAQRVLLKKGDSFYVPPGNIYRLENFSKVKSCMIFWTVIKPLNETEDAAATEQTTKDAAKIEAVNV